jgi:hypothetical protein
MLSRIVPTASNKCTCSPTFMSKLCHLYIKELISATFSGIQGAVPYAVASAITGGTIAIKYPLFLHKFVRFRTERTIVSTVGSVTEVTRFNNRGRERRKHEPCRVIFFATCMLSVQRIHCIDPRVTMRNNKQDVRKN